MRFLRCETSAKPFNSRRDRYTVEFKCVSVCGGGGGGGEGEGEGYGVAASCKQPHKQTYGEHKNTKRLGRKDKAPRGTRIDIYTTVWERGKNRK